MSSDPVFSDAVAIRVQGLSKCYQIYDAPRDRLKQLVSPQLQRLIGQPPKQYFREFWALRDVSFEVKKGEMVGIVGRNGSGKSTLLQIICGTLSPTNGSVETFGRIAALLELGSGFNPEFTGRENVYLNAAVLGLSKEEIDGRFDDIATFADIGAFLDQPVRVYSSGMFVRLAFSIAVTVAPDILVVDEALAVGDTPFQAKCLARIRHMQDDGVAILFVTHATNTIIEYCSRAIYMKNGRMLRSGAAFSVVESYTHDLVVAEGGTNIQTQCQHLPGNDPLEELGAGQRLGPAVPTEFISVQIKDAQGLERGAFSHGEYLTVEAKIRFVEKNLAPCFGIQIVSTDGIVLWAATTDKLGQVLPPVTEKGEYVMSWLLHVTFAANRYVLALGAGDVVSGQYKRHSRLHYAGHFDVLPQEHSGYGWLSPKPEFSFKKRGTSSDAGSSSALDG